MDQLSFSPSELIYLFLDGEHTGVERSVLFRAMADNQELQHEFEDALKMRTAALNEASEIVPPAAVTQSLMSRAGFGIAGAAVGTSTTGWFAGMFGNWSTTALLVTLPLLTAIGGYIGGYRTAQGAADKQTSVAQSSIQEKSTSPISGVAASASNSEQNSVAAQSQNAKVASQPKLELKLNEFEKSLGILKQQILRKDRELALVRSQLSESKASGNFLANATKTSQDLSSLRSEIQGKTQAQEQSTIGAQPNNSIAGISPAVFVQQPPVIQLQHISVGDAASSSMTFASTDNSASSMPDYSFGLRRVWSLSQPLQSRIDPNARYDISLFSIDFHYTLSDHLQLYVEGGRDNFVTYDYSSASNSKIPFSSIPPENRPVFQNILWGCVGARYMTSPVAFDGAVRLFVQGGVGASNNGLVAKLMPGISWQADRRVAFVFGLDNTLVRTGYKGNINYPIMTSLSTGLSLNF